MLFTLLHLLNAKIIDYNETKDLVRTNDYPFVVYYYYHYSKNSTKNHMKQIDLCSKVFPKINFVRVNCSKFNDLCEEHKIIDEESTLIMKYPKYKQFTGELIAFDLIKFFEENTDQKRIEVRTSFSVLTPENFSNYLNSKASSLIAFLDMSERMSELMIPQLQQIAFIFSSNLRTGVAYIDCNKYIDFCIDNHNIDLAPTFRAYRRKPFNINSINSYESNNQNNENDNQNNGLSDYIFIEYSGPREFDNLLEFANSELHESRKADGELNKQAGIIPSLFPLIQQFMKSEEKTQIIEEIKKVQGSEYYLTIIKKLLRKGEDALSFEETKIRKMMINTQEKLAVRDVLRQSLNVLKEFKRAGPYTPPSHTDSEL
ncbi:hypothetical protein TRFO_40282 [Tritrichomonas foetus]|uniref:Uncharacterized protein n=1 Tax=Tritrichomonas foetus TaxID=1144522 RepID=A0A1J4J7N2_9EUKA|nr:hypothetical protein TRFO_40282 [Tritrichomonas foetus]|eukprot:OHS93445.1 hypothetical protein TRFO_40282 [Tritrichomonas foetus]